MATLSKNLNRLRNYFSGKTVVIPKPDGKLKLKTVDPTERAYDTLWTMKNNPKYNAFINNYASRTQNRMYLQYEYDLMERDPIISRALTLISQEACLTDQMGDIIQIETENNNVKKTLEHLFYEIMNVQALLPSWIRLMLKYGDCYLYLDLQEGVGITDIVQLGSADVERQENQETGETEFSINTFGGDIKEEYIAHFRHAISVEFFPYGQCLAGDTRVTTKNGYKEIKDIERGDIVPSFDTITQTKKYSKVLDTVYSGEKEVFKIETSHNFVEASKEHKILVYDNNYNEFKYKTVPNLKIGDLLILDPKSKNCTNKKIDKTKPLENKNGYWNTIDNIPDIDDEEFAEFLGFLNFDEFLLEPIKNIESCGNKPTYDIFVENSNHNFYANGIVVHNSMLEAVRKYWKMQMLLEDFMMVYYLLRSVNQRVFRVDVGALDPNKVPDFIEKFRQLYKKKPLVDQQTGDYDIYYDPMSYIEDIILPVREGYDNTEFDEIPPSPETNILEGIDVLRQKIMSGLGIPNFLLNYEEQINSRSTLSSEDIRFAKLVEGIQSIIVSELEKIAITHLILQGYGKKDILDVKLSLTPPSNLHQMEKFELMERQVEIASQMKEAGFHSKEFIWRQIFNMSEDEIDEMKQEIQQDMVDEQVNEETVANIDLEPQGEGMEDTEDVEADTGGGEGSQGGMPEGEKRSDQDSRSGRAEELLSDRGSGAPERRISSPDDLDV